MITYTEPLRATDMTERTSRKNKTARYNAKGDDFKNIAVSRFMEEREKYSLKNKKNGVIYTGSIYKLSIMLDVSIDSLTKLFINKLKESVLYNFEKV